MAELPVEKCALDRSVELRFEYEVDDLAEDIRERGQLQPVIAYEKDGRYYVFVGMRRYYAIKKLYEAYGEPKTIKAIVLGYEPSPGEKLEMALSENEKRSELNIYEKIALVINHGEQAEKVMSGSFIKRVRVLLSQVTVEKLRRWYRIEKQLGGVKLKLPHLIRISQLPEEAQDFAVFFFHEFSIPEQAEVSDFRRLVLSTRLTAEQRRKLEELGLKNPYEEEKPSIPQISEEPEPLAHLAESTLTEAPQWEEEPEEIREESEEEEHERTLLITESVQALVAEGRVYVFYRDEEPEVELIKAEDQKVVEVGGERYRIRIAT